MTFDVQIKMPHSGFFNRIGGGVLNKIAFPFIFTSKNFALAQHGATIAFDGTDTTATEDSSFPVSNLIDGNRSSICQIDGISPWQSLSPAYNGFGKIHLDMSGSIAAGDEINLIVLENDLRYPVYEVSLSSYTSSDFSTGKVDHAINREFGSVTVPVSVYEYGFQPKIDSIDLATTGPGSTPYLDDDLLAGAFDGRYAFFGLQTPITNANPYIELRFRIPGRNHYGENASFKNGLWDFPDDETLESSDPNTAHADSSSPVYLWDDDYIQLDGTDLTFKRTRSLVHFFRPDHMYILQWWNKCTFGGVSGPPYEIEIDYYDRGGSSLGTFSLFAETGASDLTWTQRWVPINHKRDGSRYSGRQTSALFPVEHEVPAEAAGFNIEFHIPVHAAPASIWKIDDLCLYSANNESVISELVNIYYGPAGSERLITFPQIWDNSGTIKLKRLGFYSYDFGTTKQRGQTSYIQDLGGRASANPAGVSYQPKGKVTQRNFVGQVIGQFVSKAGIKQGRAFEVIATKEQRAKIDDYYASSTPFGVIEPQGDFADYVIAEGSLRWRAIAAEKLSDPGDYFWQGSMVLEEI